MWRTGLIFVVLAGCHPSASVQNTTPIANLQPYQTVELRVKNHGYAGVLERSVVAELGQRCSFSIVDHGGPPADLVVSLDIVGMRRGGDNKYIRNQNEAVADAVLVLSEGGTHDLLGTSRIHSTSSGVNVSGQSPENEAIGAIAKAVVDDLATSGCSGPRVARAAPPPPPAPSPSEDPAKRQQADQLNSDGTEKLESADFPGALAAFTQASQLLPDPRYVFNECLVLEAQEQWDQAAATCQRAKSMNPEDRLVQKIDKRLELINQHK